MTTSTQELTTQLDAIPKIVCRLRENFNTGFTRPLAYRQSQLAALARFMKEQECNIEAALRSDLGKPTAEALSAEICLTVTELKLAQKKLASWMQPKKVSTAMIAQPGTSHIYAEPLGVVLIIAPWNYPLQTMLVPLIGAIAAGNCVVLKPSEVAPATSQFLARELPNYLDRDSLAVVQGGVPETTALLAEHVDHIFYTGNGSVGRIVMTAAAKNLTPVTLELGGKSPCIVDHDADLSVAARRIIWGKFSNAGQTCVAPDYVLAHESIENELLEKMRTAVHEFYGDHPEASPDYGRVVNAHHYHRLLNLLPGSGDVFIGGNGDEKTRYLAPTILRHVPADAPIMADEIFGPILPVLTFKTIDDAITLINARPKPLALYLFSSSAATRKRVIKNTSSGGVCVNYTLLHLAVPALPFGGVGASGMGAYHGKASFDTFSHHKSVLTKPTWFDPSILYPPYTKNFMRLIRWFM